MDVPLLASKLQIPSPSPLLISRPRLTSLLDESFARGCHVTLVCAPAGYGKTTLLSHWVLTSDIPTIWLTLDKGENDVTRFLSYFIKALQSMDPCLGQGLLDGLQSPQPLSLDIVLTSLINEIDAGNTLTQPLITSDFRLVLDDYHTIASEAIHHIVSFLITNLPQNVHLVMITRSDPPLPISRLRGDGRLCELRMKQLRFTTEECCQLIQQRLGENLSLADIEALVTRTEGWVTGLQMAATLIQGREDKSDVIANFSGSDRYIIDYLLTEVLQQQPQTVQEFLLQTAILDELCSSLCDAVVYGLSSCSEILRPNLRSLPGNSPAHTVLAYLEESNLFLVPLDRERHWYRYHHLFADLLAQRLHQAYPQHIPELHRRASLWYEGENRMDKAIHHALEAGDFDRAIELMTGVAEARILASEVSSVQQWLNAVPPSLLATHPVLHLYQIGLQIFSGQKLEIVQEQLADCIADNPNPIEVGMVAVFRALIASYQGRTSACIRHGRRALETLPPDALFLRGLLAQALGQSYLYEGDLTAASKALAEASGVGQVVGNTLITALCLCLQAEIAVIRGELLEAHALYEDALRIAQTDNGPLPIAGSALIGIGQLMLESDRVTDALDLLQEGIPLAKKWSITACIQGYHALALAWAASGNMQEAETTLDMAESLAHRFDVTHIDDVIVESARVQFWCLENNTSALRNYLARKNLSRNALVTRLTVPDDTLPALVNLIDQTALARALIHTGDLNQAAEVLRLALTTAEARGWRGHVIQLLALRAILHTRRENTRSARDCINKALQFAEPHGYVRVFTAAGTPIKSLLQDAVLAGVAPAYAARLSSQLADDEPSHTLRSGPGEPSKLLDPLSPREEEVIHLLVRGLTNQEIAEQLVVAVSTVKSHINHIYQKLDVSSRTQAVLRARDIGLAG